MAARLGCATGGVLFLVISFVMFANALGDRAEQYDPKPYSALHHALMLSVWLGLPLVVSAIVGTIYLALRRRP